MGSQVIVGVAFVVAFVLFSASFVAMNLHDLARRKQRREGDA